ncbi:hypothetical protein FQR65_LT13564 [Abscondita terminalis]|nr:hypothetical protein FQR65_LT13564 [Abscondita terminalis]
MMYKIESSFWCLCLISLSYSIDAAVLTNQDLTKYKHLIDGQGLYSAEDDVKVLTSFNFVKEVYGKNYALLVEFYNSWCGFCQRFAPSWKALATDIREWKSMVSVAAFDCSDDLNSQLCRDYEIMSYPTLRYFHENYTQGTENIGVEVEKGEDIYSHKKKLIQRLVQEQKEHRGGQYPILLPVTATNVHDLYDAAPRDVKYTFLVLEDTNSIIGAELALDLKGVRNITVRYAQNNTQLAANVHVKTLPALIVIDFNKQIQVLGVNLTSKEAARTAIKDYLLPTHIEIPSVTTKGKIFTGKWINAKVPDMSELMDAHARETLRQKVKKMGDVVFQADLETALRYTFKHEVASTKTITGERLTALINYVSVLIKYFPFGFYGREFLVDLYNKIKKAGDVLDGSDVNFWIREAESEDRKIFSSPAQWVGCQGSSKNFRGYPCGLWKMFHFLTVSAAEHNSGNNDANPHEVLNAMYGYVKNFFGCSDCSRHFQEMATKKDIAGVSSLDTAILWLWMAHNEVNKRLSGDATEDPEFPKIQFPIHERCPTCRVNNTWNLQEVITYLKQVYSTINVRYIGSDTRILHLGLEGPPDNGSAIIFYKNVDSSMCLILYRGYKKKMYVHDLLGKV